MIGINNMIQDLMKDYKELSVDCVKNLCENVAGVPYRDFSEVDELQDDLYSKGYRLFVHKYKRNKENGIGQFILLTDENKNLIKGFNVYIDVSTFSIQKRNVTNEAQLPFFIPKKGAH